MAAKKKKVYTLPFGESDDPALVGGKGASLSRMVRMGLPVPPGFTVTTEAWRDWRAGELTLPALMRQVQAQGRATLPEFGQNPGVLISVRSGAPMSMPGMMDTVLNVGIDLNAPKHSAQIVFNFYRSLAKAVGVESEAMDAETDRLLVRHGKFFVHQLPPSVLAMLFRRLRAMIGPKSPIKNWAARTASLATLLVLQSWDSERARLYRAEHGIADDLGTAVNYQRMVFGTDGGSGVMLTRDPGTGEATPMIDWVPGGQGDVVVDGTALVESGAALRDSYPGLYARLLKIAADLERRYGDAMDIEFTIEHGALYVLQCRPMKRNPTSAARIALEMYAQGRLPVTRLRTLQIPPTERFELVVQTLPSVLVSASTPVVGKLVHGQAFFAGDMPEDAVIFRHTTTPNDLGLMLKARAVVTATGGPTCHAALVAREFDKPTFVSAQGHVGAMAFSGPTGRMLKHGSPLTILPDGRIFAGHLEIERVPVPDEWHARLTRLQDLVAQAPTVGDLVLPQAA